MNGKFINKLAAGGRGPGEYTGIMGFDVSSDNKMLILLSSNKIFEYSNTGSEFVFLKTIDLSRPAPLYSSFVPGTTNIMLSIPSWYGNESTLSLLVDINGDTLNLRENYYKYELVEKRHAFSTWDAIQYVMDDRVCFNEKLSDTVFCVSSESNNFMPWLILDSRGTLINTKIMSDVEYAKSHSSEYSQVAYIYEVPRYVFYYYRYKDLSHKIIYDKKENRKYEIALKEALKDNLSGGPDFNLNVYTSTAGYFYSSAEALALRKHVAGEDFAKADAQNPEKKEKLRKIADSLEDSDNPVLILVSPKQ